jgi:hypothetical protein
MTRFERRLFFMTLTEQIGRPRRVNREGAEDMPMGSEERLREGVASALECYRRLSGSTAGHARQRIAQVGIVKALSGFVMSSDLQKGFKVLRDAHQLEKTFESVVVRNPDLFSSDAVVSAQWRLDHADEL